MPRLLSDRRSFSVSVLLGANFESFLTLSLGTASPLSVSYRHEVCIGWRAGESDCNLPQLTATLGQRARFYIFTLGTEDDLHAPSITASTFVDNVRCWPATPHAVIYKSGAAMLDLIDL